MSVSTNDIKKKIAATENMSKITKAMQMVSVSKLGKTEHRIKHFRGYRAEIKNTVATLQASEYVSEHLFLKGHKDKKKSKMGCVVITSNRGLVGGYNNNLFKLLKESSEELLSEQAVKFYVTGQKGAIFARSELPDDVTSTFLFSDDIQYREMMELARMLITDYLTGAIKEVVVFYQDFISKLAQEPTKKVLLPIEFKQTAHLKVPPYEIRPNEKKVVEGLLLQYVMTSLYELFLSANLSEHAARMNAMSNATDNAAEIIKESKLIYNRARQAAITQELNEIVAGANAVN